MYEVEQKVFGQISHNWKELTETCQSFLLRWHLMWRECKKCEKKIRKKWRCILNTLCNHRVARPLMASCRYSRRKSGIDYITPSQCTSRLSNASLLSCTLNFIAWLTWAPVRVAFCSQSLDCDAIKRRDLYYTWHLFIQVFVLVTVVPVGFV